MNVLKCKTLRNIEALAQLAMLGVVCNIRTVGYFTSLHPSTLVQCQLCPLATQDIAIIICQW